MTSIDNRANLLKVTDDIPVADLYRLVDNLASYACGSGRPGESLIALALLFNRCDDGMRGVVIEKLVEFAYLQTKEAQQHIAAYVRIVDAEFNGAPKAEE